MYAWVSLQSFKKRINNQTITARFFELLQRNAVGNS